MIFSGFSLRQSLVIQIRKLVFFLCCSLKPFFSVTIFRVATNSSSFNCSCSGFSADYHGCSILLQRLLSDAGKVKMVSREKRKVGKTFND